LLEEIWVREIYLNAIKMSYPLLYKYLQSKPEINTCLKLHEAVQLQSIEPDVQIVMAVQTSAKAEHPRAIARSNREGLKLIGGGAMVDYEGPGNLLTGSYPEGNAWVASSKSHKESSLATVTAYAIYLYDPDDLWEVKMVTAKTQAKSTRPEATAILPDGYALTGGGALVDWDGYGIMLTECRPIESNGVYMGWRAKGKDHASVSDNGNATAWVFGIRPRNDVKPTPSKVYHQTKQGGSLPTLSCRADDLQEVIVGGGAAVTYRGPGGLLTSSGLAEGHTAWKAQAKDHLDGDSTLDLTAWMFTRKGKVIK